MSPGIRWNGDMREVFWGVFYWGFLALPIFLITAQVLMLPAALIARLLWEPTQYPVIVQIVLSGVALLGYAMGVVAVWYVWKRARRPWAFGVDSESGNQEPVSTPQGPDT